ncbi:intracellular septation protein [Bisgaardia hudsonensis]|uniref:Inner membrane-spanning protein YciB n=1 Tax=Bisgaardia hudsonensis TaxID=109472 RepID=A0A4R2N356_9PAST|nr:septation protein A [Bisgaardia hudsonensis]QLB12711.1 septation protein A [Bisgaardia hudsonensis]TCP14259.1 intracellular septation protein [Bisgaardia hudsonensis]
MKQLLEFIPLILFFIVYKFFGIREASLVLTIATVIQLVVLKLFYGKIEKQQLFMGISVIFFGSLTAYLNDVKYLQWKVTIVYAIFALILLVGQFVFKKPLIKQLLGKEISLPDNVWKTLNLGWAVFFIVCMLANIYISQFLSEDAWVNFKSFGIIGLTFIATIITGIYIYRYLPKENKK